jgi:hypothetical protein
MVQGSRSWVATEPAVNPACDPTVTPGPTKAPAFSILVFQCLPKPLPGLVVTNGPSTSTSISVRTKQETAWEGWSTIGKAETLDAEMLKGSEEMGGRNAETLKC